MRTRTILMLFPFAPNKFRRFYEACKRNDWHIVATVAKGQKFNHEEFKCDFVEFPAIEEDETVVYDRVKALGPFDAIVPFSEFSVVLAETLSARFGLPYNRALDPRAYRWKNIMRQMLADAGCDQPDIIAEIQPEDIVDVKTFSGLDFPVIVKPADAAGSLNVRICRSAPEVLEMVNQIRQFRMWDDVKMGFSGLALIESFAGGQEYSTELIVQNGDIVFRNDTFKFVSAPPFRDEVGHVLPAPLSAGVAKNIDLMLRKIVKGARFDNGVIHAEYKVDQGIPYVIEVAFRIPGDRISDLIELHYGISLEEALIHTRMGLPALSAPIKTPKRAYTGVKFQFPASNSLAKADSVEFVVRGERWVALSELQAARNETSLPNRVGFSVLQSDSFDDLKAYIEQSVSVKVIAANDTWVLRHKVLRPHQSLRDCEYPHDHDESSVHLGAYIDGELVGVASAFLEPRVAGTAKPSYRLRGMAVIEPLQSKGIGSILIRSLQEDVRTRGADIIWCNARTTASQFYAKHGFAKIGDEYDMPGLGPHYLLEWAAV